MIFDYWAADGLDSDRVNRPSEIFKPINAASIIIVRLLDGENRARIARPNQERVDRRLREGRRPPGLAVLKVGNEAASEVYVRNSARPRQAVSSFDYDLPIETTQKALSLIK
jgi:hypothetical protein